MIILLSLAALVAISFYIWNNASVYSNWEIVGMIGAFISIVLLATFLAALPISYYEGKAEVNKYYVLKETIDKSRENATEIERASLTNSIIEFNRYLAEVKYWNDSVFDIYYPDELAELEFLE